MYSTIVSFLVELDFHHSQMIIIGHPFQCRPDSTECRKRCYQIQVGPGSTAMGRIKHGWELAYTIEGFFMGKSSNEWGMRAPLPRVIHYGKVSSKNGAPIMGDIEVATWPKWDFVPGASADNGVPLGHHRPFKIAILGVYGGFLKWEYPQIIHFSRSSHYKLSILGYPSRKPPYSCIQSVDWMIWGYTQVGHNRNIASQVMNREWHHTVASCSISSHPIYIYIYIGICIYLKLYIYIYIYNAIDV